MLFVKKEITQFIVIPNSRLKSTLGSCNAFYRMYVYRLTCTELSLLYLLEYELDLILNLNS